MLSKRAAAARPAGLRSAPCEDPAVRQLPVLPHVEHADDVVLGVGDEQPPLVGGEDEPVRRAEAVRRQVHLARRGIHAVDVVGPDLAHGAVAFVVAGDAEVRVREPERPVGPHRRVVGTVQPLVLPAVGQHRDRAVVLGPRHPPVALLAGDQPTLPVQGVAVGVPGGPAEDADRAGLLVPAQHPVVRDVTPDHLPPRWHVQGALGPAAPGVQDLQGRVTVHAPPGPEPFVEHLVQHTALAGHRHPPIPR